MGSNHARVFAGLLGIDLICWFTDSEIVEVQPQLSSAVAEREDIALPQFRTASGVLAHINTKRLPESWFNVLYFQLIMLGRKWPMARGQLHAVQSSV